MKTRNEIMVKPYSIAQLSKLYGVSTGTFRKWVPPIKERVGVLHGRFYTVNQVEIFFKHLGLPFQMESKKLNINLN